MTCRLFSAKPLPEPMITYLQLDILEQTSVTFVSKDNIFPSRNFSRNCRLQNVYHMSTSVSYIKVADFIFCVDDESWQVGIPIHHLGPLLLTWFNFNPSMDK